MDNEMIERCVKAAQEKRPELQHMPLRDCYESIVKAVIKAMREPTHNMKLNNAKYDQSSNELWQSMIDTIINE